MPEETANLALSTDRAQRGAGVDRDDVPVELDDTVLELDRLRAVISQQDNRMACIQEIGLALGAAHSLDDLLHVIMEKITILMEADRSTLFMVDERNEELWSKVIQGDQVNEIRLQIGEGIAGWVAQTGLSMNVRDAYSDRRFNQDVDLRTGYQTRSILCQPIRNQHRTIIGVVQVLNKRSGYFSADDESLLSAIASQVAVSLENSMLYMTAVESNLQLKEIKEKLEKKISEVDLLYDIQREISQAVDLPDLIHVASRKALDTIHADICAVSIQEREHMRCFVLRRDALLPATARSWEALDLNALEPPDPTLRALTNDGFEEINAPLHQGIVGMVVDNAVPYQNNHVEQEDSILKRARETANVVVRNVVAVPFFVEDRCIGAIALVNKHAVSGGHIDFEDGDLKLLTLVAGQLAGPVAASLFRERQEKANRLATIGQMMSGVIHDFKTPVTIISGYVQLMARQNDPVVRKEYAEAVLKQFDQLNKMTKEILAFARGESTILLRRVFIHKFAEEIDELLGRDLREKHIDLVIQADYRGAVKMDDVKMKRAVFNLARNAAEAMLDGGQFTIVMAKEGDEALFHFSDTGPGIPPEIRETLFESFVTQGKAGGTGLGLAIVKKIVEEHHGTISFVTGDAGTTFSVRIPIEQD